MKIKINDGKGRRVCTEIKRPDPAAVLVIEENVEYEVTNEELNILVLAGYFDLKNTEVNGQIAKSVYCDAVVYDEKPAKKTEQVAAKPVAQTTVIKPILKG